MGSKWAWGWWSTPKALQPIQTLLDKVAQTVGKGRDDEWWLKVHEDRLVTLIRRYGSDSGPAATARTAIAIRLEHLGRFDEARLLREEVVAAHRRDRGEDDLHTLVQEEWLVHDLWALGEREQARDLAIHIHQVRSRDQGVSHEDTLRTEALLKSIEER